MGYELRIAKSAEITQIWRNFNETVEEGIYLPNFTKVFDLNQMYYWYEDLIKNNGFCMIAVVKESERDDLVVGQCVIESIDWEAAEHVGQLGIIVSKEYRDQGIGTKLLLDSIEYANSHGKTKIILSTYLNNERAIATYEKVGFTRVGVRKKQFKVRDEYLDELLMEKLIPGL